MLARGRRGWVQALLAAALLFGVDSARAQVLVPEPVRPPEEPGFASLDPFYLWFGFHTGVSRIDPEVAARHRTSSVGPNFYVSVGVGIFDLVTLSGSLGAALPEDHADFERDVLPRLEKGTPTSTETHAQVSSYSWEVGLRTPSYCFFTNARGHCVALHGFTSFGRASLSFARFLDDCKECSLRGADLGSDTFFEPGLAFGLPSRKGVGLELRTSFRKYLDEVGVIGEVRTGFALMVF